MITVARVIGEVRRLLRDTHPDAPRHDDADIRAAMAMALFDMRRLRPDAFLAVGLGADLQQDLVDQSITQVDLEGIFMPPLALLTAAFLHVENTEYSQDGTAASMIQLARNQLTG